MPTREEFLDAIDAADEAISALEEAADKLGSARNWGLVDLFGGGFFSTWMKHSRVNQANEELAYARGALRRLGRMLEGLDLSALHIDLGAFWSFMDYFGDGLVSDLVVQSRIGRARRNLAETIRTVRAIRGRLEASLPA